MSLRGNGHTTCYDCGYAVEPGYYGTPGVCRRCDRDPADEPCVEGCGRDAGANGTDGRCVLCHLATAGARS